MSDLISRQAAIDNAHKQIWYRMNHQGMKDKIDEWLNSLPSAQPEIIRCKDCAKREYCRTSTTWAVAPDDDWYCADAERKTDG